MSNPYITYREIDSEGKLQYYVLQKEFPHLLGNISETYSIGNWYAPIGGYRLYVSFAGTIRGFMLPSYTNIGEEINLVLTSMAEWFLQNRIITDDKRYKKFKINATSPIQ